MPRPETGWIGGALHAGFLGWRSSKDPAQTLRLLHKGRGWGLGPVALAQGLSTLVARVPWSEKQGLATEASPHSASRHHVFPAIGGP